jgi:hypothetical protein
MAGVEHNDYFQKRVQSYVSAPWSYDRDAGLFVVNGVQVEPASLLEHNVWLNDETHSRQNAQTIMSEWVLALCGTWGHPVSLPKFYRYLGQRQIVSSYEEFREMQREVSDVMSDVLYQVDGSAQFPGELKDQRRAPFCPDVDLIRKEHPHINLTTFGNCACLGVAVDGTYLFGQDEWPLQVAEYKFHNTDFDAQQISLLAGLGHIAFLAEQNG